MNPKVSVCIPTYNGENFIRHCLDSVLNQTLKEIEILIVDDCSSDDTLSIAYEYSKKDKRIQVFENESNLGLVRNWNKCIELSRGEWIKYVFQDDYLDASCIEQLLEVSLETSLPLSFCLRKFDFDEKVSPIVKEYYQGHATSISSMYSNQRGIDNKDFMKLLLSLNDPLDIYHANHIGEPTVMLIRRDMFFKYGIYNENFIQNCDFELAYRIAINEGIAYIDQVLATFRVHSQSTTNSNLARKQFKAKKLEHLLMLHEFAFNPVYFLLRKNFMINGYNLQMLFFKLLSETHLLVKTYKELEEPFKRFVEEYPIMKVLFRFPILLHIKNRAYSIAIEGKHFLRKMIGKPPYPPYYK